MQRVNEMRGYLGEIIRAGAVRVMRRLDELRNGAGKRRMRVLESLALGGRRQLLLVLCDEQEYLVGTGAESVATIVPRQPSGSPAAAARANSVPADAAQTAVPQAAGLPSVAARRAVAAARSQPDRGPRLVASGPQTFAENRIREADLGRGRHLWQ